MDDIAARELSNALHGMFQTYQRTGNHEVRECLVAVGRGLSALLGADVREFFPDAPVIADQTPPDAGAPTMPGRAGPGWPAGQQTPQGFVATQPVVDSAGQPVQPTPASAPAAAVNVAHANQVNPSGGEMRIVSGPGVGTHPAAYPAEPGPGNAAAPVVYPRRKRNR